MKKLFSLLILFSLFFSLSGEQLIITINADNEILQNNYSIYNSINGEILIAKSVEIPGNVEMTGYTVRYSKPKSNLNHIRKPNPDYSTSNEDSAFMDIPSEHIKIQKASLANSTVILVSFFPLIYSDYASDYASEAEITLSYSRLPNETKSSRFDKPVSNESSFNYAKSLSDTATLDLVIITSEKFADSLGALNEFENMMGFKSAVMTVEDIYEHFSGADEQEKIRNYIKSEYSSKGIRFVIIAGDCSAVPSRISYSALYYHNGFVATDLYYSDMNGTWNADNDDMIGELVNDIEDGFPDVIVSRMPFSNFSELKIILDKFFGYIYSRGSNKANSFLFLGASLLADLTDGCGQAMSEGILGMSGFEKFDAQKLYAPLSDTFNAVPSYSGDVRLTRSSFAYALSCGYHFINHIDHSTEFYLGTGNFDSKTEYNSQDTLLLSNENKMYSIMFTMGCSANGYDRESVSNGLLLSARSSVANLVGFTRTGWTSSQGLMNRYWKMMADSLTKITGEAFKFALTDNTLYFRVAVNMIGLATMPVYSENPDTFIVSVRDTVSSEDDLTISVMDSKGAVKNALIVLKSDAVYMRVNTDDYGNATINSHNLFGRVKIGVSKKNHIPYIDSIYSSGSRDILVSNASLIQSKYISIDLKNVSDTAMSFSHIHAGGNDTLFFFNKDLYGLSLNPQEEMTILCTLYFFKRPVRSVAKKIGYEITGEGFSIKDSLAIEINNSGFAVETVEFSQNDTPFVKLITLTKDSMYAVNDMSVTVKSLSSTFTVIDSLYSVSSWTEGILEFEDIRIKKNSSDADIKNAMYRITLNCALRTDTIDVRGLPADTEMTISVSTQLDNTAVYVSQNLCSLEIFKSNSLSSGFVKIAVLESGVLLYKDFDASLGINYYYGVFYDNLGRAIDTTDTVSSELYAEIELSDVKLSGSFYGSLDGKRYYARSSMNSADLDNNGVKELVVVADDGRLYILDENMNDITPFTLFTTPHNETTPALGDIDMNGYIDIVMGNGSMASDTTAFVIFNPMLNDRRIEAVLSLGALTASPVIADIDCDNFNEILLGTSTSFTVLESNLTKIDKMSKTIVNVWGIAVSEDRGMIFINDYYGNIYSYDFSGNARAGFPFKTAQITLTPLILTDIDCNMTLDIVIGTAGAKLFVIDENGKLRSGFPYTCLAGIYHTPRLFDIGNDHNIEIIFSDISGNLYVMNNSGTRVSYLYTGEPTNTYNEILIYDYNGDMKEDFVFVMRSGKIAVYNQQLSPLYTRFVKLENIVTSCPAAIDFRGDMKPSLIIRDYAGQLYKINSYTTNSEVGKISFSKTLYDTRNTSFVSGFLLHSENEDTLKPTKAFKNTVSIKNSIEKNSISFSYKSSSEKLSVSIVNVIGQTIANFMLPERKETFVKNIDRLGSGEYFVFVKDSRDLLLKEKILIMN